MHGSAQPKISSTNSKTASTTEPDKRLRAEVKCHLKDCRSASLEGQRRPARGPTWSGSSLATAIEKLACDGHLCVVVVSFY